MLDLHSPPVLFLNFQFILSTKKEIKEGKVFPSLPSHAATLCALSAPLPLGAQPLKPLLSADINSLASFGSVADKPRGGR